MSSRAVTGVAPLDRRLANGDVLLLDGGMGTELEARGVPMDHDAWSAVANLEHEDTVEQAHVDFLHAGADILIANTFPAGLFALDAAGLGERFEEVNRRGVEAAVRARNRAASDRPVAVAGSISPLSAGARVAVADRPRDELLAAYRRQADVLAAAGADLIITEMIQSADWHRPAVQAAAETGLPTWLGVSAGPMESDGRVPTLRSSQESLAEVVSGLLEFRVSAVAVMHTDIDAVDDALDVVRRAWDGVIAVYPHHGEYRPPSWRFEELNAEGLGHRARGWIDQGAQIVGGCCGVRPDHVRALSEQVLSPGR